ncbi:anti-sigma factor family protein [Streptomyces thermolilacinus]|uniref:anti-sigma factor family protein n=1 Tax=Streptomyces thermolilacinus TaxID=285540 RepID=UPI0033CABDD5
MTSTADTTQHPDVSEISDLAEGILPPSRTADVRRHLDRCELCADVRDSLEEIRGLLGTLPGPPRMPVDVVERIDAALAAEVLLDATAPDHTDVVSRETPQEPATSAADRPRSGAVDRPVAAPAGRPSGSSGPGRAPARRRRRSRVISAVCGLAAASLGVLLFQAADPTSDTPTATHVKSASGPDERLFSGAALPDKVRSLLSSPERTEAGTSPRLQSEGAPADSPDPMIKRTGPALPECVRQGVDRDEEPLGTERGEYRGRSAYLVVLPHPRTGTQVDVYIVDASCTTAKTSSGPADVLLEESQPRP